MGFSCNYKYTIPDNYFDLIATTGSSFAANHAGTIPEMMPITEAVIMPLIMFE